MKTTVRITTILVFAALLAACGSDSKPTASTSGTKPETMIGKAAEKAIAEARKDLAKESIKLRPDSGVPEGEITAQGDLLIGGKALTIDDKQRALLLEYRKRLHGLAEVGMDLGTQGADLAGKAIKESIGNIFGGDTEAFEKRMEAEGKKMEIAALKLCDLMPGVLDAQNAVVASLPAFKPYAGITQKDVDECRSENGELNGDVVNKVFDNVFDEKVQVNIDIDPSGNEGMNAAEEAEAAGVEPAKK
jgi:hypothetical protein